MDTSTTLLKLIPPLIALLVLGACTSDSAPEGGRSLPSPSPTAAQAAWKVRVHPAGTQGKPTKREKRAVASQAQRLEDLVTRISDGILFDDRTLEPLAPRWVTPEVLAALKKSRIGPPDGVSDARTTLRRALIGVQARTARRASATVTAVARVGEGKEGVRWRQHLTLWLERGERWRVVAFEGVREPIRQHNTRKDNKNGKGDGGRKRQDGDGGGDKG